MVAVWLPVLAVMLTFVVDVGNWFVHKRHLQMQADAAALAGAQDFGRVPGPRPITRRWPQYGGDTYNAQIGGTPAGARAPADQQQDVLQPAGESRRHHEGSPCAAGMLDVKLTEIDLPWFFPSFFSALLAEVAVHQRAGARVGQSGRHAASGALPVGVPDTNPKAAHATFINEATGAVLGSTDLVKAGTSNGLAVWDNAGAPLPVTFDAATADSIGVVIALGGLTSTTCGQPLVTCYDAGRSAAAGGAAVAGHRPRARLVRRGHGAQPTDPILRGVTLVPGSCVGPVLLLRRLQLHVRRPGARRLRPRRPRRRRPAPSSRPPSAARPSTLTYSAATGIWSSPTTPARWRPAPGR